MKQNQSVNLSIILLVLISTIPLFVNEVNSTEDISFMQNKRLSDPSVQSLGVDLCYGDGQVFAIWEEHFYSEDRKGDIFLSQSKNGITYSDKFMVNDISDDTQWQPSFFFDKSGILNIVYTDSGSANKGLFFTKYDNKTLSTRNKINNIEEPIVGGYPEISSYENNIYITYNAIDDYTYLLVSNNIGISYNTIKLDDYVEKRVQTNKNGLIYLLANKHGEELYLLKSTDNGNQFSEPVVINPLEQTPRHISMDIDKDGNLYFFWIDYQTGLGHFSKSIDGGVTFSKPVTVDDDNGYDRSSKTSICVDEWNGVYITWCDDRNGNQDVFLSVSRDGGQTFSDAVKVNDDSTSTNQRNPSMCCDEVGNLFIAWEDDRDEETNIYYTKVDALDHSPRIIGNLPTTFNMIEDQVPSDPFVSLDEYFEDDDDDENLEYEVSDPINETFFQPRLEEGDLYFDPSQEDLFGIYDYRLRAIDAGEDGIPNTQDDIPSAWIDITLIVEPVNDPPKVIGDLSNSFESGEININVKEGNYYNSTLLFQEVDGEECTITTAEDHPTFDLDLENGDFSFLPGNEDVGEKRFLITIMDENLSSTDIWIVFNVSNQNNGPIALESMINRTMEEDNILTNIDVSQWFLDPDGDELIFSVEGSEHIEGSIHEGSLLDIFPANNWSGEEVLKIIGNDSYFYASIDILVKVNAVNDPPSNIQVNIPDTEFKEGGSQKITATANDNEGQTLTYEWYVDDKLIGTGSSIDLGLSEGNHLVKLIVTDENGAESSKYFEIEVEGEDGNGFALLMIIIIIIAVLILLSTIIIIGLVVITKSSKKRSKDIPEQDEDDKPKNELDSEIENLF